MGIDLDELRRLRRARDRMDREFATPLDVAGLARGACMSPAHFIRRFRAAYGETPYAYLMTRRIERAKALLRAGAGVTEACHAVGCTSLGSFSASFTALVGRTPSRYRAEAPMSAPRMRGVSSCHLMRIERPAGRRGTERSSSFGEARAAVGV